MERQLRSRRKNPISPWSLTAEICQMAAVSFTASVLSRRHQKSVLVLSSVAILIILYTIYVPTVEDTPYFIAQRDTTHEEEIEDNSVYAPDTQYEALMAMRRRAQQARNRCQSNNSDFERWLAEVLGISRFSSILGDLSSRTLTSRKDYSLLLTPIPKAGWSTLVNILYKHYRVDPSKIKWHGWDIPYHLVGMSVSYLHWIVDRSAYRERIIFVRNPYDRLVSAYKEKALSENGKYVRQFSNPCHWLSLAPTYDKTVLSFKEFIGCILMNSRSTFFESSSRSIGIQLDQHWAPQVHLSLPCSTNYTLIGKKEHFTDDVTAAMKLLHIYGTVVHSNKSPDHLSKELSYWYKQLDSEMISQLQKLYKYDFEIFGYDPAPPL